MSDLSDEQKQSVKVLKQLIDCLEDNPNLLHRPELEFFRNYITSLGGIVPAFKMSAPESDPGKTEEPETESAKVEEIESEESDVEIDDSGCIEPDVVDETIQVMGDSEKEVTEEEMDKSNEVKAEAMGFYADGKFNEAIEVFTKAILQNPRSAMLYTKRGQCFLKLEKPNACIKDCTEALNLNSDYAAAYKYRGRAYRLLGEWEKGAQDLRQACKIDFDEEADEWLKDVQKRALALEAHKVRQERKRLDKEEKERRERIAKAREAHAKAAEASSNDDFGGDTGGFQDFMKIFQDPEIMAALSDPEIAAAFQDIKNNPANSIKYHSNPKVMAFMEKILKVGGLSGFPGAAGFPGAGAGPGAGGFPGGAPNFPTGEPKMSDDDGLD